MSDDGSIVMKANSWAAGSDERQINQEQLAPAAHARWHIITRLLLPYRSVCGRLQWVHFVPARELRIACCISTSCCACHVASQASYQSGGKSRNGNQEAGNKQRQSNKQ